MIFKRFGISICLSTLDYHLGILKKDSYIKSYRNYGRRPDGTCFNKPSNRSLRGKAFHLLKSTGVKIPGWLWKWLKHQTQPKQPNINNKELPQQDLDQRSGSGFSKITPLEKFYPP